MSDLPRLLIVSEATLSRDSRGANRTLANLFESYPANRLMIFAPEEQLRAEPTAPPFEQRSCGFTGQYIPPIRNRIGKLISPITTAINLQLLDWSQIANRERLEVFKPDILLICPITPLCLLIGYKVATYFDRPFLIYFMDDWVATNHFQWFSGNVQTLTRQSLSKSAGWLMISEQLQESLSERYQIKPKQAIVVHNPVDLSGKELPNFESATDAVFTIVYAGSIWPMHYDAVAVMAEAIFQLRQEGKEIELVLHTAASFWNQYKENWQNWEVVNGAYIPYEQLNHYLQKGDLLLVASSFLPEQSFMTGSSVQTKITDYMASGKPIVSCGPQYSACNRFIKKFNCGLICETNKISEVKTFLIEQMTNRHSNQRYAKTAFKVLKERFERTKISNELYAFIKQVSSKNKIAY